MIVGKKKKSLDEMLEIIGEWNIFQHYLPGFKKVKDKFSSPFRSDSEPSCVVTITNKGHMFFKDYGNTEDRGGWFWLVKKANYCTDAEVADCLERDFNTANPKLFIKPEFLVPSSSISRKNYANIEAEIIPWTEESFDYWNDFEFTQEELEKANIFHLNRENLYIYNQRVGIPKEEMVYGYYFPQDEHYSEGWKILRPFCKDKKDKWRTNVPSDRMENLFNCDPSKPLIIQKSRKDRLIITRLYANTCNSQNESEDWCTDANLEWIEKFPEVYVFFDSDVAGKRASKKITEKRGWKHLNCPDGLLKRKINDPSGWVEYDGMQKLENFLKQKNII